MIHDKIKDALESAQAILNPLSRGALRSEKYKEEVRDKIREALEVVRAGG